MENKEEEMKESEVLMENRDNSSSGLKVKLTGEEMSDSSYHLWEAIKGSNLPRRFRAESPWAGIRGDLSQKEWVLKIVQGILDELNIMKFGFYCAVIAAGTTSAEILKGVISLIVDKAVLQPILSPKFARLCYELDNELNGKPVSLKQVLLSKCEELFEGIYKLKSELRDRVSAVSPGQELEHWAQQGMLKLVTIGDICLIGELFKEKMLPQIFVHQTVEKLLEPDTKSEEENTDIFFNSIVKLLDERPKLRPGVDVCFNRLKELTLNNGMAPQVWIMVHHVVNLLPNNCCHLQLQSGPMDTRIKGETPSAERGTEDQVLRTAERILDKLTPEKLNFVTGQLVNAITSVENLEGVTSLIYEKSVMEPTMCSMYAQLCYNIQVGLGPFPEQDSDGKVITFNRILLNKCQQTFEGFRAQVRQLSVADQKLEDMDKQTVMLLKVRTLGNIRLIGELLKHGMVTERITHRILQELLELDGKSSIAEENIEAICVLLNTIGGWYDANPKSRPDSDIYFNRLKEVASTPHLAPHLRNMVHSLVDLRENKWVPVPRLQEGGPTPTSPVKVEAPSPARTGNLSEKDQILKIVQGILNKLTPEKFGLLKGQLVIDAAIITSAEILKGIVSLIFDMAVVEPTLCPMYAQLCFDLHQKLPSFPPEEPCGKEITLRQLVLNKCQEAFESNDNMLSRRHEAKQMPTVLNLGNIRFICELVKQKLVPEKIVHHIVQELLGTDTRSFLVQNIEGICQIFHTVGKQLDECPDSRHMNDTSFSMLEERLTCTDLELTPRLRFMLHDILDLRANNWVSNNHQQAKSKTIIEEAKENPGLQFGAKENPPTNKSDQLRKETVSVLEQYSSVRPLDKALHGIEGLNSPSYHSLSATSNTGRSTGRGQSAGHDQSIGYARWTDNDQPFIDTPCHNYGRGQTQSRRHQCQICGKLGHLALNCYNRFNENEFPPQRRDQPILQSQRPSSSSYQRNINMASTSSFVDHFNSKNEPHHWRPKQPPSQGHLP